MVDVKNPKVLIVILNYKTYELTINLAEQLKELNYNNYDILVVDNCSPIILNRSWRQKLIY